jgi:osmotically-inducible protein OsmY
MQHFPRRSILLKYLLACVAITGLTTLSGCFTLVATGVAVGALATADRRTYGAQTDDQAIELKGSGRLNESDKRLGGVSITSYNRKVLLTGQVLNEDDKKLAEQIVARVENVRSIHNELAISGRSGFGAAASDTTITAKVKASLFDTKEIHANTIKVVTEGSIVYLMGLLSQKEAAKAAQSAAGVSGVSKVVTVFEIISDAEMERLQQRTKDNTKDDLKK